jgi:DNA invertase Pin-like site-specific DNA recombinase
LPDQIEGNGVRTVIVEDASRFARELITQELGILALINRGVRVLTANGDDLTDSSEPSRVMMRQIAGAHHQYEKARLVAKLKVARDRKRAAGVKVEGRKSNVEIDAAEQEGRCLHLLESFGAKAQRVVALHCEPWPPIWRRRASSVAVDDRMRPPRSGAC